MYLLYFEYTIAPFPGMFCSLDQIICYVESASVTPCPVKVITLTQFEKSAVGIVQSTENLEFYTQIVCIYASTQGWFPLKIPRFLGIFRFVSGFYFPHYTFLKMCLTSHCFHSSSFQTLFPHWQFPHLPLPFSDSET